MIQVRIMTEANVPLGMRLKAANGWNQTEADWRRYLGMQPDGCFVAELDGKPVGTVTTCVFGPVAWIAMVLVDADHRGRGVGKALMGHALDFLERQGVRSVRLDATPLGQPLYEKQGFVAEYALLRYEGVLPHGKEMANVEPLLPDHLENALLLDRAVTQTDRRKLLQRWRASFPKPCVLCVGRTSWKGTAPPGRAHAPFSSAHALPWARRANSSWMTAGGSMAASRYLSTSLQVTSRQSVGPRNPA